jgi:uncharacterized membrane protein
MMPDAAHIHPALVHFPIVLIIFGVVGDLVLLLRSQSLTGPGCLSRMAAGAVLCGAAFSVPTAFIGDMAFDQAVSLGFPQGPLLQHHHLGIATTVILVTLATVRAFAWLKGYKLTGRAGWIYWGFSLLALGVLVATAFFGGHLVYDLGVNVAPHGA